MRVLLDSCWWPPSFCAWDHESSCTGENRGLPVSWLSGFLSESKVMSLYLIALNGLVFFSCCAAPLVFVLFVLIWSGFALIVSMGIFKALWGLKSWRVKCLIPPYLSIVFWILIYSEQISINSSLILPDRKLLHFTDAPAPGVLTQHQGACMHRTCLVLP